MARERLFDRMQAYPFWVFDASGVAGNVLFSIFDPVLGFVSCTAPEINAEPRAVKPGNWEYAHQVFKSASISPVVFARGAQFFDSDFYNWITNTIRGLQPVRRNLVIVHFLTFRPLRAAINTQGGSSGIGPELGTTSIVERVPGRAWLLHDCIPTRYKAGSDFEATSSDVSIQELEVQPEYVTEMTISTLSPLAGRALSAGVNTGLAVASAV